MTSSLANQLKAIKLTQNALKVGPHQEQPTILFDKQTARNTSIDTIYSMAILSYSKLQSGLSNSLEQVHNREELLNESMKEINRNTLTKEQNSKLSRKLQKFIIQLAPYLLNAECQQVLEYLLRNFKINVFEAETLSLAFLQYWNYEIYQKVIANVPKKQHTGKLTFLNQLTSSQQINFAFIVKTLTFSHALLDKLISIILEGSLLEIRSSKDEVIKMQSDDYNDEKLLKHPLKNFLLKIFLTLIKDKKTTHYKYVIDFASSCLRIKYPQRLTDEGFELIASVLILLSNLVYENAVSDEYILRVVKKLGSKFLSQEGQNYQVSDRTLKVVCDFILLVWQRKTHIIDKDLVETLNQNVFFLNYINKSTCSKYMIFHHLWNMILVENEVKCQAIIQSIGVNIKSEEFYRLYEHKFLSIMFESYQSALNNSSIGKENVSWLCKFIQSVFKHELGTWMNERVKLDAKVSDKVINQIFVQSEIDRKTGLVLVQKILKVVPQKKHAEKVHLGIERTRMQEENVESEDEEKHQVNRELKKGKKIIELLRGKGVNVEDEIDFSDEGVKKVLIELFESSYSSSDEQKMTFHQRALILQKYGSSVSYTPAMFSQDLKTTQFSIPIKFFSARAQASAPEQLNIQVEFAYLQNIFTFIVDNREHLQSILFKELLRLLVGSLLVLAEGKYKQVVVFLAKYYKKLTNTCKSLAEYVQVNQLMVKLSERLFEHAGNSKGKYQSLIHCHCRVLSILINAIDSHELKQNSSPIVTTALLQSTYTSLVSIFGAKQLYLINIGVIELITRKELNYQKLKFFIEQIMIKELNYEVEEKKESVTGLDYYEHALAVGRELVFASYMLGSSEPQWLGSLSPILTSGIAKNQVSIFYGFIKEKLKRNIVRKIFLFFKLTYESKLFTSGFGSYLSTIDQHQMQKLLHVYSQIYYILLSIDFRDDPKIQAIIEKLMDKVTNLFSLDLRLRLFKPLLPNSKLYGYLNEQLAAHREADYDELSELVNVVPDEISDSWVGFVKQCLKRGHYITSSSAQSIFTNAHFLNSQSNFPSISQLICHLSDYSPQTLTPYINQSMNVIMVICQTDPNQDYCLSLLYKVVVNLREMVDPFVGQVYKYVLECESEFVNKFIQDTVEGLTVPTLIEAVKTLVKQSNHLFNFGIFFKHVCKHGVGHLLVKTLQYYASKIIHSSITDQVDLSNLYELVAEIFLEMTMKFNENELRKVLIDFVRWSQTKQNEEIAIKFNMRKIVIGWVYCKLSAQLKGLFTSFYGYVFDSYLKDLQMISEGDKNKEKLVDSKRHRNSNTEFANEMTVSYVKRVLESLGLLFENDGEKQFLDGTKFDLLSERLSQLYIVQGLDYSQYMRMASSLSDCLLTLCQYLTDDYQLKSLNLKILLLLRYKVPQVQEAILTFMDKLIDRIQDRYLLFINDLVPFLIDNIHNRNEKVKAPIKSIINKFEEMSGSKIENYMR